MEDAHAIVLDLEAANDKQNCFFAVYDGHGGGLLWSCTVSSISHINLPGSTVAKFAGLNVHKRLVREEAYKDEDYKLALKKAFLGTDEDLLASQFTFCLLSILLPTRYISRPCAYKRSFGLYGRCGATHTR